MRKRRKGKRKDQDRDEGEMGRDWEEEDVEMMMIGGVAGEGFSMERGDYDLMSRRLEGKKRGASEGASTFKGKPSSPLPKVQQHHTESA